MSQLSSYVDWNHAVMLFTAIVGLWYFYSAATCLIQGTTKRAEALLNVGLALAWMSVWAVYNPHNFAALMPLVMKGVLVLGVTGFVVGLGWSILPKLRLKRSRHAAASRPSGA